MITDFDDFCLWVYCIVDEIYQAIEPMLGLAGRVRSVVTVS